MLSGGMIVGTLTIIIIEAQDQTMFYLEHVLDQISKGLSSLT